MYPSGSAPRRDSECLFHESLPSNASEKLSITLRGIILDSVEIDGYGKCVCVCLFIHVYLLRPTKTSDQARLPAELKHINKRRKRN